MNCLPHTQQIYVCCSIHCYSGQNELVCILEVRNPILAFNVEDLMLSGELVTLVTLQLSVYVRPNQHFCDGMNTEKKD